MNRRNDLPRGWRQPPETTAEPVPLRRPYVPPGAVFASADLVPPPPSRPRLLPPPGAAPREAAPRAGAPLASAPLASGPRASRPRAGAPRATKPWPVPPGLLRGAPPRPLPAGVPRGPAPGSAPAAPPQPARLRLPAMRRWRPMRSIIGDEVRVPVLWCEFGACIARYTSRDALGERDLRARAQATGWRYDGLGRLACPSCVRHDPAFRGRPPEPAGQDPRRRRF
jgi:hypothetical protein